MAKISVLQSIVIFCLVVLYRYTGGKYTFLNNELLHRLTHKNILQFFNPPHVDAREHCTREGVGAEINTNQAQRFMSWDNIRTTVLQLGLLKNFATDFVLVGKVLLCVKVTQISEILIF